MEAPWPCATGLAPPPLHPPAHTRTHRTIAFISPPLDAPQLNPPSTPSPLQAFAADLEKLFSSLQAIDAELIVQAGAGGAMSASVAADDAAVNRFLLDLVR